jgi:CheY-like chemotaxis protein
LRQILLNIIGNAIKFTDEGRVTLRVKKSTSMERGLLIFEVTDTGCGISKDDQGHLFQPFVQADNSATRKYGGTGLGLALSRKLARAIGGDLVLTESNLGKGSTFTLSIEIGDTNGAVRAQDEAASLDSSSPFRATRLDGIHVLLAEDHPEIAELISGFLSRAGATVKHVINGHQAVAAARSGSFDVILMDVQMPQLDGYAAAQTLRKEGVQIPIVALTAHAMVEEREKCLASGCNDFLTKPVDVNRLLATVFKTARPGATPKV